MPILGIIDSAKAGNLWPANSYESIATLTPSSGTTASFTSIPSTYKHLQIRYNIMCASGNNVTYTVNNDSGNNYSGQGLGITNTPSMRAYVYTASTPGFLMGYGSTNGTSGTYPNVGIIDFIDYASTSKNKTVRAYAGVNSNNNTSNCVELTQNTWYSLTAINRIDIFPGTYASGTTIALYGIKGS